MFKNIALFSKITFFSCMLLSSYHTTSVFDLRTYKIDNSKMQELVDSQIKLNNLQINQLTQANIKNKTMINLALYTVFYIAYFYTVYRLYCKETTRSSSEKNEIWTVYQPGMIQETFNTVIGADSAKTACQEFVSFLNNPIDFCKLGAKAPKGILLTGSPGTGKTLLARALAGEAKCTFISCSAANFNSKWIGEASKNIRNLFKAARECNGPCIIFIDEFDALAAKRQQDGSAYSQSHNEIINTLLTELDGFESKDNTYPIFLICATNFPHVLDDAVTRPGRIDRIIEIPLPTYQNRITLLKSYVQNNKIVIDSNVDFKAIAERTSNFSGAQLTTLINQATLLATQRNAPAVQMKDFDAALKNI